MVAWGMSGVKPDLQGVVSTTGARGYKVVVVRVRPRVRNCASKVSIELHGRMGRSGKTLPVGQLVVFHSKAWPPILGESYVSSCRGPTSSRAEDQRPRPLSSGIGRLPRNPAPSDGVQPLAAAATLASDRSIR